MTKHLAIGRMSSTSRSGIDAAFIKTADGDATLNNPHNRLVAQRLVQAPVRAGHRDDWIAIDSDHSYDFTGVLTASGTVDKVALSRMLNDSVFVELIPKSLDRKDSDLEAVILNLMRARPKRLVALGGGQKNSTTIAARHSKRLPVTLPETTGLGSPLIGGHLVLPETKSGRRARA